VFFHADLVLFKDLLEFKEVQSDDVVEYTVEGDGHGMVEHAGCFSLTELEEHADSLEVEAL